MHLTGRGALLDRFAPTNWASLNSRDGDLGSTNPVLLGGNRVFQIGKSGIGYLLDSAHLGGIGGQIVSAKVCDGEPLGGVSRAGSTVYVPRAEGITAVSIRNDRLAVEWKAHIATPGPPIITGTAIWTVATTLGKLIGLRATTGATVTSQPIGPVPSQFTSPAGGDGLIAVAANRTIIAFSD